MRYLLTSLAALAVSLPAHALTVGKVTHVNLGGVSYHYNPDGSHHLGYNESNPGLGATWKAQDKFLGDVSLSAGYYHNSIGNDSLFATVDKVLVQAGAIKVGVSAGLATGYLWTVMPIAAVQACGDYACLLVSPPVHGMTPGVAAVQFRYPY